MKRAVPLFLFLALSTFIASLSAAPPVVINVRAAQRPGTSLVDILYDVSDPDGNSPLRISFKVSSDAGATWTVPVFTYQGAGPNVLPGNNRSIVWNAGMDWTGHFTELCRVRVIADDGTVPPEKIGMVLIPAGTFQMGNNYSAVEGDSNELPVHSVFVSAFYMETNEVTKTLWDRYISDTTALGYQFNNSGSSYGANHPVQTVSWFDVVKWCNARSESEGLTPIYYTDAALTAIYRSGQQAPFAKWDANGYRLPTEAEWEKAARGGLDGQHFPWPSFGGVYTAHISCANANYSGCNSSSTKAVASHPANAFGLYDMAGNVTEWCWDWYQSDWYSQAGATQSDTRGPGPGSYRLLRGGSWNVYPSSLRCALRGGNSPVSAYVGFGFRCVRGL